MELLSILIMIFLVYLMLTIIARGKYSERFSSIIMCILTLYIGMMVRIDGISLSNRAIISPSSNEGFIIFVILTLMSAIGILAIAGESLGGKNAKK